MYQGFVHPLATARDHCHGFPLIFRMRGRVHARVPETGITRKMNGESEFVDLLGSFSGIFTEISENRWVYMGRLFAFGRVLEGE